VSKLKGIFIKPPPEVHLLHRRQYLQKHPKETSSNNQTKAAVKPHHHGATATTALKEKLKKCAF
jgi:hypothetical protein